MRDDALVRTHTKDYVETDRKRLGLAVIRAREAAGYPKRPAFAERAGISLRSLLKLETGVPVGAVVYEAVARALPGWTEDTPVRILRGESPPPPESAADPEPTQARLATHAPLLRPPRFTNEWLIYYAHLLPNEEDFLEVKLLVLALQRLQARVTELEEELAERQLPQSALVQNAHIEPQ